MNIIVELVRILCRVFLVFILLFRLILNIYNPISIHSGWSWDQWLRAAWHVLIIWPAPGPSNHMQHTFKHTKHSCLVIYTHMRCISPAHGVLMSSLKIQTYKLYNLALAINPLNNCFPLYRVNTSNNKLISMIIKDNKHNRNALKNISLIIE